MGVDDTFTLDMIDGAVKKAKNLSIVPVGGYYFLAEGGGGFVPVVRGHKGPVIYIHQRARPYWENWLERTNLVGKVELIESDTIPEL